MITRENAVNVDSLGFVLMYNFLYVHHILLGFYSFSLIFLFLYMWGFGGLFAVCLGYVRLHLCTPGGQRSAPFARCLRAPLPALTQVFLH